MRDNWNFYNCTTPEDYHNLLLGFARSPYYRGGLDEEIELASQSVNKKKSRKNISNVISLSKYKASKNSKKDFGRE